MRLTRRQAWLLVAAAGWTYYVWLTRIWNLLGDPSRGLGFKVTHVVIAAISLVLLGAVGRLGILGLLESQAERQKADHSASGP